MGSLKNRISCLEGRIGRPEDEDATVRRSITTMVLDELAHLKASHARGDLMALAIRRVVEDQYEDLGAEARETIIEGWTREMREWGKLDWLVTTGRANAPDGWYPR